MCRSDQSTEVASANNLAAQRNVVTLTGIVPTEGEKARALDTARKTDGVKSVVDNLKVGK